MKATEWKFLGQLFTEVMRSQDDWRDELGSRTNSELESFSHEHRVYWRGMEGEEIGVIGQLVKEAYMRAAELAEIELITRKVQDES